MTKQEEIREGIYRIIIKKDYTTLSEQFDWERQLVGDILSYLHSQGVVIKVGRELPSSLTSHIPLLKAMLDELGFEAVEPLIEEANNE